MSRVPRAMKQLAKNTLFRLGYECRKRPSKPDTFPTYLSEAQKSGMDVNDWIEEKLGWGQALPILEEIVFPYLRKDSTVCELGAGTGRWARHFATQLRDGELHLVDHSPWIVSFLKGYFRERNRVYVHLNDGVSLPFGNREWIDLVVSAGTFIALKLGSFYLYSREFFRVLKPGGYCILDYIDITTPQGWDHLVTHSAQHWNTFTYHHLETVDRVFTSAGFEIVTRHPRKDGTYLVARKATSRIPSST